MSDRAKQNKRVHRHHKKSERVEHPDNLLFFEFGKYKGIGLKSFIGLAKYQRRTNIFRQLLVPDEKVFLQCFKILETDKYNEIINTTEFNEKLGKKTVWIVGFQTDVLTLQRDNFFYFYFTFSFDTCEEAVNGIAKGEKYLLCNNVVLDVSRHLLSLNGKKVEETLCYYLDEDNKYKWKKEIKRHTSDGIKRY